MAFIIRRASHILSSVSSQLPLFGLTPYLSYLPRLKTSSVFQSCVNLNCRSVSGPYNILYAGSTFPPTQPFEGAQESIDDISQIERKYDAQFSKGMKKKLYLLNYYEKLMKEGKGINSIEAFKMIKACGRFMIGETSSTRNELARYMWSELEKNGVGLDTSLWNTLLSVYNENRFDFEPLVFLNEMMEKSNSEANHSTYSLLGQAYALKGDPVGAMKIADFVMQTTGTMPNYLYQWVIVAYAKSGDIDGVEMTLREMKKNGSNPDLDIYEQLLNVHSERGDMDSVNKMIQEMMENGITPTIKTYFGILEHLSISGHSDLIETAFKQIGDAMEIKLDIDHIILQCVSQGEYKSALLLLKNITENTSKAARSFWFYVEIKLYERLRYLGKDMDEYMKVSTMMEKYLDEPKLSRLSIMIKFLASNGHEDEALNILKTLLEDGKPILTKHFHPILQSVDDGKNIPEIVDIYKLMLDNGIELDYYCFKDVRHGLGEPGSDKYKSFFELIKDDDRIMLSHGFFSDVINSNNVTLNELVNASASLEINVLFRFVRALRKQLLSNFEVEEGLSLISLLHEKGYNSIRFVIEENVSKLLSEDKYDDAFALVNGLLKKDIKIPPSAYTEMLKYLRINGRSGEFFDLIHLMNTYGVEPNPQQYYQIIKMASKVGNALVAQFSFEKIITSEKFANKEKVLYEDLILAYYYDRESVGNIEGRCAKVTTLFEEMIGKGHNPKKLITVVVKSHLDANDVDGASKMVEKCNTTEVDFNYILIQAFLDRKEFDKAESLFDRVKEQIPHKQLGRIYNEMLRIPAFIGDVDKMKKIYQEMMDNEISTNHNTYASRINTYLKAGKPEACIDIIQEEGAKYPEYITVVRSTIQKLILTGNLENVQKVIDFAKEHWQEMMLFPNELDMVKIMVNVKAGNFEDASRLLSEIDVDFKENLHIENPFRKVARIALYDQDVHFIENMIQFLEMHDLHDEACVLEGMVKV